MAALHKIDIVFYLWLQYVHLCHKHGIEKEHRSTAACRHKEEDGVGVVHVQPRQCSLYVSFEHLRNKISLRSSILKTCYVI